MLNWNAIDTVLFDLDGTLIDLHLDAYFWTELVPKVYAEKYQLSAYESQQQLHRLYKEIEHSMQWYDVDHWAVQLQLPIRDMLRKHAMNTQVRSGVYPLLRRLREMGKQLIILTDSHPFSMQVKMDNCELSDYFDHLVSSHQFQKPKMHSELWHILYQTYQLNPNRTLLLDDLETVLDQAKQNGLAYTIGIEKPHSQMPTKTFLRHRSIDHFKRLWM